MISRFGPRTTRDPRANRVPIATSEWPEISGATSGSNAARSVDRSTSMYASTGAGDPDHTVRSARPRPFAGMRTTATYGSPSARCSATYGVASVLALSAIVIRNAYGNVAVRYACNRRTHGPRSISSL